jgi:hypothetical protein
VIEAEAAVVEAELAAEVIEAEAAVVEAELEEGPPEA